MTQDIAPVYLHPHNAANESVTLHEGPVVLHNGAATSAGTENSRCGFCRQLVFGLR